MHLPKQGCVTSKTGAYLPAQRGVCAFLNEGAPCVRASDPHGTAHLLLQQVGASGRPPPPMRARTRASTRTRERRARARRVHVPKKDVCSLKGDRAPSTMRLCPFLKENVYLPKQGYVPSKTGVYIPKKGRVLTQRRPCTFPRRSCTFLKEACLCTNTPFHVAISLLVDVFAHGGSVRTPLSCVRPYIFLLCGAHYNAVMSDGSAPRRRLSLPKPPRASSAQPRPPAPATGVHAGGGVDGGDGDNNASGAVAVVTRPSTNKRPLEMPPPPLGWKFGKDAKVVLMADGAMAVDKGLAAVLSSRQQAQDEDEDDRVAPNSQLALRFSSRQYVNYMFSGAVGEVVECLNAIAENATHVYIDCEWLVRASNARPRPNNLRGGKVAVLALTSPHLVQGAYIHVISLRAYEEHGLLHDDIRCSLEELLDSHDVKIRGHNVRGDITRMINDLDILGFGFVPQVRDTMTLARRLLGPREPWNPASK